MACLRNSSDCRLPLSLRNSTSLLPWVVRSSAAMRRSDAVGGGGPGQDAVRVPSVSRATPYHGARRDQRLLWPFVAGSGAFVGGGASEIGTRSVISCSAS